MSWLSLVPLKGWLALGLAGVLAGALWYHQHEIGERDALIAERDKTIATRDITIANQALSISAERLIVSKLQGTITEQNSAIALWQAKAKQSEALAAKRALEVLRVGEQAAEALRDTHTHLEPGHASVNQWLCERFQSCAP